MAQPQGGLTYIRQVMSSLTTSYLQYVRQQMDVSNHEMLNMLTQQINNVFNPLIQNTNHSYQQWMHQIGQIMSFFGAPQETTQPISNNHATTGYTCRTIHTHALQRKTPLTTVEKGIPSRLTDVVR